MRDIYHALITHDFTNLSDTELVESRNTFGDASTGINSALQVIGNLIMEVEVGEDYTPEDASRDLLLVGAVLKYLPRMAMALELNSGNADFELKKRKGISK